MSFMEDLWLDVQPHLGQEAEALASGLQLGKAPGGQGVVAWGETQGLPCSRWMDAMPLSWALSH